MSYRMIVLTTNPINGALLPQGLIPQGQRLMSLTVLASNSADLDGYGISAVQLRFGGADRDPVPAQQGMQWVAPEKPNGQPGVETGGVWISNPATGTIQGYVFYVEFAPEES